MDRHTFSIVEKKRKKNSYSRTFSTTSDIISNLSIDVPICIQREGITFFKQQHYFPSVFLVGHHQIKSHKTCEQNQAIVVMR
jgi:hypothetical protein